MDNLKLLEPSNLDEYQMSNRTFDPKRDAWRVSVVDGITLNVDQINIPEGAFQQTQQPIHTVEVKEIQIPHIIKEVEIHKIEIPTIVTQIEYKTVEVPVFVPQIQIVEIEKPVIVKEIQIVEKEIMVTSKVVKVCAIVQAVAIVGLLIANLILKG